MTLKQKLHAMSFEEFNEFMYKAPACMLYTCNDWSYRYDRFKRGKLTSDFLMSDKEYIIHKICEMWGWLEQL